MKRKRNDMFCLFAVIVGVLGSALLLRLAFSWSLEAYSDQVQTSAQGERIRPPLQEAENGESSITSDSRHGEETPESMDPQVGDEFSEVGGLPSSPMENDVYLAGYISSQRTNAEIREICYNRYGQYPLSVVKTYMESPHSTTGYAWYGVAQMPEEVPVIFHYAGPSDIWTQRNVVSDVYYFLDEQTDSAKSELRRIISNGMVDWSETGHTDWAD